MQRLGESVDGDEDTDQNCRNPSDLHGKSRTCTAGKEKFGDDEEGFGVEVARDYDGVRSGSKESDRSRGSTFVLKDEALKFGDGVMKRYGFSELKLSIYSQKLVSDLSSSLAASRNAAVCRTEEVPVADGDTVSKVMVSESKNEMVVRFVRKSPHADTLKVATADTEALGDFEGCGRVHLGKRKANVDMSCGAVGEPRKHADLGFSIEKEDTETANESFAEKSHLDALEIAEQPSIAAEEVLTFSNAKENASGKHGAAAVDQASLSDTSAKEECASVPVNVTPNTRKQKSLRHKFNDAKPLVTRSRTRGAKKSDETDEDRGTEDASKDNDIGENLGVSESGKKV